MYCSIMILKDTDRKEVYIVKTARREIEGRPVLAVCYDFDRTLSPENMQDGYIRAVDYDLAYMYKMLQSARGKEILNKERLKQYGGKVRLYDGIRGWFRRINAYGERRGILVEHYIISSGLREIIEGTAIAKDFTHIYASSFYYNEHGEPCWPAQVINYTNKTQFLFRIEKGILDIKASCASRSEISYTSATVPRISPVCALSIHWAAIPSASTIWKIRTAKIRYVG